MVLPGLPSVIIVLHLDLPQQTIALQHYHLPLIDMWFTSSSAPLDSESEVIASTTTFS